MTNHTLRVGQKEAPMTNGQLHLAALREAIRELHHLDILPKHFPITLAQLEAACEAAKDEHDAATYAATRAAEQAAKEGKPCQ